MTQIVKKKKKWGQSVIKKNRVINTPFLSSWGRRHENKKNEKF
jgi:hypothetical protein